MASRGRECVSRIFVCIPVDEALWSVFWVSSFQVCCRTCFQCFLFLIFSGAFTTSSVFRMLFFLVFTVSSHPDCFLVYARRFGVQELTASQTCMRAMNTFKAAHIGTTSQSTNWHGWPHERSPPSSRVEMGGKIGRERVSRSFLF